MLLAVDVNEVTDYYSVIRQPMDFSTIRRKLEVTAQNLAASLHVLYMYTYTYMYMHMYMYMYLGTLCCVMC